MKLHEVIKNIIGKNYELSIQFGSNLNDFSLLNLARLKIIVFDFILTYIYMYV